MSEPKHKKAPPTGGGHPAGQEPKRIEPKRAETPAQPHAAQPRAQKMVWKPPAALIRLCVAVAALGLVVFLAYPRAAQLADEARDSRAAAKGRVLLRGAQIVATEQLVATNDWDAATRYLQSKTNLDEILKAAKFPVEQPEVTSLTLDQKGIIKQFDCALNYDGFRYRVVIDAVENTAQPTVLEQLPKE